MFSSSSVLLRTSISKTNWAGFVNSVFFSPFRLSVDIVAERYPVLDEQQENTPEQKWLMENAYRYGFILRYPADKCHLTGIGYEPWHYRYVGKEAAKQMYDAGLCLEEYLGELDSGNSPDI